jgi:uncharacterized membrane protein YsdA (DUF1294 family)
MFIYLALAYLTLINGFAFLTFSVDKRRAIMREWRIPEANLLYLALAGGWLGAKFGQHLLRHKTRKQPFRTLLNLVPLVWIGAAGLIAATPDELPAKAANILTDVFTPAPKHTANLPHRPTPRFFQRVSN